MMNTPANAATGTVSANAEPTFFAPRLVTVDTPSRADKERLQTLGLDLTEHAGRAGHTIAQWHVDDVPATARELAARGVQFEHFDAPGMQWDGDVSFTEGMGHAAWFRDSEDNVLCLDSGFPPV